MALLHALFFTGWAAFNSSPLAFDPYPFTFLTMVVSLEAIFLPFFIMIGQPIAGRDSERRHQLDLQINLLNEREMTAMLRLMGTIANKLEISQADQADQAEARAFAHNRPARPAGADRQRRTRCPAVVLSGSLGEQVV